jgi:DNA-binding MarR family transcriptional regulator
MKSTFIVPHSVFDLDLTSTELIVIIYLISHNLSQFSPTVNTIAGSTNLGRASVCRSLKTLQERNLLSIDKKLTSYGLRINKYSLTLEN